MLFPSLRFCIVSPSRHGDSFAQFQRNKFVVVVWRNIAITLIDPDWSILNERNRLLSASASVAKRLATSRVFPAVMQPGKSGR